MGDHIAKTDKSDDLEKMLKLVFRKDLKTEEGKELYDKWASTYEKDLATAKYSGHNALTEEVVSFYGNVRDLKIMDGAAGTELVGKAMYNHGFKCIDALDCSNSMLDEAKKLGVYQNYFQEFLGSNKFPIPDGGHILTVMNSRHFNDNPEVPTFGKRFEERMMKLQGDGLWTRLERKILDNYYGDFQCMFFNLKKC